MTEEFFSFLWKSLAAMIIVAIPVFFIASWAVKRILKEQKTLVEWCIREMTRQSEEAAKKAEESHLIVLGAIERRLEK